MNHHVEFVDYAAYCMNAERALKNLHNAVLIKNFSTAKKEALKAMVESKLTYNAILAMEEDQNALHKQAETV